MLARLSNASCIRQNGRFLPGSKRNASSPASVMARRLEVWEGAKAARNTKKIDPAEITIQLPDGSSKMGAAGVVTPYQIAKQVSSGLAEDAIIAKLDGGTLWDMHRPLERSARLELLKWPNPMAQEVFWHSSSHVLGSAIEKFYGDDALLCDGPATHEGFFYEFFLDHKTNQSQSAASSSHFPKLLEIMKQIVKQKLPFERLVISREEALRLFEANRFKIELIKNLPPNEVLTAYRCGDFVDLCRGPHLPHTGHVKALSLEKTSSAYPDGDSTKAPLSRIYGISFPQQKLLTEFQHFREEAAKRDHRLIGKQQQLFMFSTLSPGAPFFLPHGTRVYNRLVEMLRAEYRMRGYEEVITPQVFDQKLWQTSGHWENYKENMFTVAPCGHHHHTHDPKSKEGETVGERSSVMGLKPMNCPGHCLIFDSTARSYRELPLRVADFGVLHRNELSGALTGLTRVIRFEQDDAHIFCTEDQIGSEIEGCLDFIRKVYGVFGFEFHMKLSTRPENALGDVKLWEKAESVLKDAITRGGYSFTVNERDGAFYGPKIDIDVTDALKRKHQCATIQLDFQLPRRFGLSYTAEDGQKHIPVMIHRAILGSLERMMAILIEHTAGKWPFWLSPRQCVILSVSDQQLDYANRVRDALLAPSATASSPSSSANYYIDVDVDGRSTLQKKIREAQLAQYNFILVVGAEEQKNGTVSVRTRDSQAARGTATIDQLREEFAQLTRDFK